MGTCAKKKFRRAIDVKIILGLRPDNGRRREIRYYWCRECKAYHLTSKPKRGKQDGMQTGSLREMPMAMPLPSHRREGAILCRYAGQHSGHTQ